jgi:hypothetical protein
MPLILCEDGDSAALWAAEQFRRLGLAAELVPSSLLGSARRWDHRIDAGGATIAIDLADGRRLSSEEPVPILNRLSMVPLQALRAAAGRDYGYAVQEMSAFHLSWLHAWPATVINRPTPQGLSGQYRHFSAWMAMGAAAGLPTLPWTQSSDDPPERSWGPAGPGEATAFVIAGRVVLPPALPESHCAPLARLGERAGPALLGIDFVRSERLGWAMSGASPLPNLMLGGDPLIAALSEALAE